jgi:hypothetical protein
LAVRDREFTVNIILDTLKNNRQFPIKIPTVNCPNRDPRCKKHHGEYVISKYDKKTNRFFVRSYSVHKENYLESWFHSSKVKDMFISCLQKRKFTIPKLLVIVNISHSYRKKVLGLRFTEQEYKKIVKRSKKANLSLYDYARKKILV